MLKFQEIRDIKNYFEDNRFSSLLEILHADFEDMIFRKRLL